MSGLPAKRQGRGLIDLRTKYAAGKIPKFRGIIQRQIGLIVHLRGGMSGGASK